MTDTETTDPNFGERTGQDDPKASCAVYVRRPVAEYSPFEEVFEFYQTEPEVSQERSGSAGVRYYLTRESRTGRPGVDNTEASCGMFPLPKVPKEVRERAAEMADFIDPDPDWEEESVVVEEDND